MISSVTKITPIYERRAQLVLILLWLVLHVVLFAIHGVRLNDADTQQYLKYANGIAQDFHFANDYYLKYVGYPLFLALIFKLGLGLTGVAVVQTVFSGVATILFNNMRLNGRKHLLDYTATPSRSLKPALPCNPPVCTATMRLPFSK